VSQTQSSPSGWAGPRALSAPLQTGPVTPYLCYDPQVKKTGRLRKVVDETTQARCALGKGIIREEVWQDSRGVIVRYNLAFINHALCARDNGRVVGYDNSHGDHHRHFAGAKEKFAFVNYERLLERFLDEVRELRQKRESI
jgi:hypothetical protein